MKYVLATFLALGSFSAQAFELSCKVTEVIDDSILEESLSVEEYPDIKITDEEAWLGMSLYSLADGDSIERKNTFGFHVILEVKSAHGETFVVTYEDLPGRRLGNITYREAGGLEFSDLAKIDCN